MFNITLRFLLCRYFGWILGNFEKDLNYGENKEFRCCDDFANKNKTVLISTVKSFAVRCWSYTIPCFVFRMAMAIRKKQGVAQKSFCKENKPCQGIF